MAGDASNPTWNSVRGKIDKAYRGGAQSKGGSYRRVGADIIEKFNAKDGRFREISQDFYAETCADFDIDASRSHQKDGAFALWPHCLVSPRQGADKAALQEAADGVGLAGDCRDRAWRPSAQTAVPQAAWLLSLEDLGIFKDDQVRCRSFHTGGWGVLQFRRTTRPHPM